MKKNTNIGRKKRRGGPGRQKKENIAPSSPTRSADSPSDISTPVTPLQERTTHHLFRDPNLTTSEKKLSVNNKEEIPSPPEDSFPATIVHLEKLKDLFSGVVCKECYEPVELFHNKLASRGLSICLQVKCSACPNKTTTTTSRNTKSNVPEVNKAWVASGVNIGQGYAQLSKQSEILGMPALSRSTHKKIQQQCFDGITKTARKNTSKARDIIKDLYEPDADGYYNIPVTFDGTWHKRCYTSKHGCGAVICALTGLVLDAHVMSRHCQVNIWLNVILFEKSNIWVIMLFPNHAILYNLHVNGKG